MEPTVRDPAVIARVLAWHNRHPLARRIRADQVQSIGRVVLPFEVPGSQAAVLQPSAAVEVRSPNSAADPLDPVAEAAMLTGPSRPAESAESTDLVPEVVFSDGESESPSLDGHDSPAGPMDPAVAAANAADEDSSVALPHAIAGLEDGRPAAPGPEAPGAGQGATGLATTEADGYHWPTRTPPAATGPAVDRPRWHPARWWPRARRWRALFSEDCIERLSPRRVAAIARRHGHVEPPGSPTAPERWLQIDPAQQAAGEVGAVPVYLLTAAVVAGDTRHRLLLSPAPGGPVFGHRLWDRRRLAGAGALTTVALSLGLVLSLGWSGRAQDMAPAEGAQAASPVASAASSIQVAAAGSAARPASGSTADAASPGSAAQTLAVANPASAPVPTAAASAPVIDGDEPPLVADAGSAARQATAASDRPLDVDPRWGRFELPILKRHIDEDHRREARERAAKRQAEAAAHASTSPATAMAQAARPAPERGMAARPEPKRADPAPAAVAPAAPTAPPQGRSTTGARVWAVVLPTIDDRRHAQLAMLKLREVGALVRGEQHAELLPVGKGWRAILFPFADANSAEHARIALAGQGLPAEVVEF